jgi:hypothetical protein
MLSAVNNADDMDDWVEDFFDLFNGSAASDPALRARMVADQFMVLDPTAARAVTREQFLSALPMRQPMFARLGVDRLVLVTCEVTTLDERHVLARTGWRPDPEWEDGTVLRSDFVLRRVRAEAEPDHDSPSRDYAQMVMYLNHQDLDALAASRAEPVE